MHIAPDCGDCAGHRGQSTDKSAAKSDQSVAAPAVDVTPVRQCWPAQRICCIDCQNRSESDPERLRIGMLKDPDRNGNAERSTNDEEEAALPLYIPAQRPEIGCLYANAAGHHQ